MKRIAFVLAAALLGTGCVVTTTDDPVGTLDVAWWFVRTKHDTTTLSYTCAQAGIDSVVVSSTRGWSRDLPCDGGALDGAVFSALAGTQTLTLTGYRGPAALYRSVFNVTIVEGATEPLDADLWGIPDDLDIYAWFVDRDGFDVGWSTCALAGVATLSWSLVDWAGTVVDSHSAACTNPAGVSYSGASALDRDQYAIRVQGFPSGSIVETFDSATTRVAPACDGQAFNHYGPGVGTWDVWLYDVSTNLTLCN